VAFLNGKAGRFPKDATVRHHVQRNTRLAKLVARHFQLCAAFVGQLALGWTLVQIESPIGPVAALKFNLVILGLIDDCCASHSHQTSLLFKWVKRKH
jgi:hypothetical protein